MTYCTHTNCTKKATYGYRLYKATFCFKHSLRNMVNLSPKKCYFEGCNSNSSYGYNFSKKPISCVLHKTNKMFKVVGRFCYIKNCQTSPSFNYKGLKPKFCFNHKLKNMVNVRKKYKNMRDRQGITKSKATINPIKYLHLNDKERLCILALCNL